MRNVEIRLFAIGCGSCRCSWWCWAARWFAAVWVRVGDGSVWSNNRHFLGKEAWLVSEWPTNGECKHYLSSLEAGTPTRALAGWIKACCVCKQEDQQFKGELGLEQFEGHSWTGRHRYALMTYVAYAYLQRLRLVGYRRAIRGQMATE